MRVFSLILVLTALVAAGCNRSSTDQTPSLSVTPAVYDIVLCGHCGQVKGTEVCCLEGATVCADCSWHKGSPACCKIEKPAVEDSASAAAEDSVPASGSY
jgi:hypothetical protein